MAGLCRRMTLRGEPWRGVRDVPRLMTCHDWLNDCAVFYYREQGERTGWEGRGGGRRALRTRKVMSAFWRDTQETSGGMKSKGLD